MNMDINTMSQLGVIDYYLELKKFINEFVERNYPLVKDDYKAIMNDETTDNIEYRNEIFSLLFSELDRILIKKAEENIDFIRKLEQNIPVKAITVEEYKREIIEMQQYLLEILHNYNQDKNRTGFSR